MPLSVEVTTEVEPMAQLPPRTRLEQLVRGAHLSLSDFVTRYSVVAAELGEKTAVSEAQAKRWLSGMSRHPLPVARRVLERWWKEPIDRLLSPPESTAGAAVAVIGMTEEELIVNAGRDSVAHSIQAASALDPSALEQLHAEAQKAAHAYYVTPPMTMLVDLLRLRGVVYAQLDRVQKPRQKAELYLIAGQVCGLLSSVSWDLGHPEVADEHARAAHTYGAVIDHPSLQAWARALQVTGTFWSGRPRRAVSIATAALEVAPEGTARARLLAVNARSLALLGARDEVASALAGAEFELDKAGNDSFLDEIGGELGFNRARLALCAGAAFVSLGDGERAEIEALAALELFGLVPPQLKWAAGELGARIDLAAARILRNDLAGAEDALRQVFDLESQRRTEALTRRLTDIGVVLRTSQFRRAVEATRIGEAIENFATDSLPAISAYPAITSGTD